MRKLSKPRPSAWSRRRLQAWSRREFLAEAGAVAGVILLARTPQAHSAPGEPAGDTPAASVIDSHVHFYDPTRPQGVPWPPHDDKFLYRTVLPKSYRTLPAPQPVTGAVVVEASPWVEDNQWVLDLAARESFIVSFVGNLPVGTPAFAGHLKRFAANKIFRGLRIRDRELEGALDDAAFVGDLKLLADHGLSLDLVGGKEIIGFAAGLGKAIPNLRLIIDHLAGLTVDGKPPPSDWEQPMAKLARTPNVYCKLSGLVEGTGRSDGSAPREVEFYRPVLDVMWKLFGPDRLIYASDWPVSERFAPLATVQGIIGDYCRSRGRRAEELVFPESSRTAYRWGPR